MLGSGFPCIASVNGTLLMDEAPASPLHSSHAVMFYGVGLSNLKDHQCLINNSWGKDWGYGGFSDIPFSMVKKACVPTNVNVHED